MEWTLSELRKRKMAALADLNEKAKEVFEEAVLPFLSEHPLERFSTVDKAVADLATAFGLAVYQTGNISGLSTSSGLLYEYVISIPD